MLGCLDLALPYRQLGRVLTLHCDTFAIEATLLGRQALTYIFGRICRLTPFDTQIHIASIAGAIFLCFPGILISMISNRIHSWRNVGISSAVSLLAVFGVWPLVSPARLGPFGITLWFVLLAVGLAGVFSTLLFYLYKSKVAEEGTDKTTTTATALRHGVLAALWVVLLLALNSLRQLGVWDIVLVSVLLTLIEVYIRKG